MACQYAPRNGRKYMKTRRNRRCFYKVQEVWKILKYAWDYTGWQDAAINVYGKHVKSANIRSECPGPPIYIASYSI